MEQNLNAPGATVPEASTDELASPSHSQFGTEAPGADDWPEFATREEGQAFWQGVRRGIREAGRDRAHPHMPESFSLDLVRDGCSPGLTSSKLLDPWPHIPDNEASRGLTTHGPAPAPGRAPRRDGFTPEVEQRFVRTLADTGVVADACRATGITRQAAYARRRSAAGRAFALAWDAALLIARGPLADDVMSRARHGVIDRVYRNGELVAERHRYDNRLTMAVLARLDRLAEGEGENAPVIRAVAREFDQFVGLLPDGNGAAEAFVAARFPGTPARPAAVSEPRGVLRQRPPSETEEALLARLGSYCDHGAGLPEEIDTGGLNPLEMERWTDEQFDRAEASGLLKSLSPCEWPAAAREPGPDEANGMCKVRQLYLIHHPPGPPAPEPRDDFCGCAVWEDPAAGWVTDFPPPEGFDGFEDGAPGDENYLRELAPDEREVWGDDEIEAAERAELLAEQHAARRRFFGLDEPPASPSPDGEGDDVQPGGGVIGEEDEDRAPAA